jgi:hypothetical protein
MERIQNEHDNPFGIAIRSRRDWISAFEQFGGREVNKAIGREFELRDEYGDRIWMNPYVWLEGWKPTTLEKAQREYTGVFSWEESHEFFDAEGFRMQPDEFC